LFRSSILEIMSLDAWSLGFSPRIFMRGDFVWYSESGK